MSNSVADMNNVNYVIRPVGRPKKEKSDAVFNKKEYMREYMKRYNADNKSGQLHRRNTSYYVRKFNIPKEVVDKYGIFTGCIFKCKEDIKKINQDCPLFIEDIKQYIDELQKEKKNHVADLSGVEVLKEIE